MSISRSPTIVKVESPSGPVGRLIDQVADLEAQHKELARRHAWRARNLRRVRRELEALIWPEVHDDPH